MARRGLDDVFNLGPGIPASVGCSGRVTATYALWLECVSARPSRVATGPKGKRDLTALDKLVVVQHSVILWAALYT